MNFKKQYLDYEKKLSYFFQKHALSILCVAFAIIYFWYGILKVVGISPAEELVKKSTDWIFSHEFVVFLGFWEMVIGVCFIFKKTRRISLWLLFLQFPGTFMPLFTNPEDCYTYFPFGLTLEGQYIFKNLILIAAGFVIIASLHSKKKEIPKTKKKSAK